MNNFILSGKGFLKSITFDVESRKYVIEWVSKIREADAFKTSNKAKQIIDKHQLEAFVWNPYKEDPIIGKWEVLSLAPYNSIDKKHIVVEWIPMRVVAEWESDVKFLQNKGAINKTYYDSYEDAVEVCRVNNLEILAELQEKINQLNKIIEKNQ